MHRLTREVMHAFDIWPLWDIELTHSTDQEVGRDIVFGTKFRLFASWARFHVDTPLLRGIIPPRMVDGRVETEVLVELVLLGDANKVREDLFLAGVLAGPVGVLCETVAVKGGPHVAATTGILVIQPGTDQPMVQERQAQGKRYHVPPRPADFSTMMKLRQLFRLIRSMAVQMPETPPPMITTAAFA